MSPERQTDALLHLNCPPVPVKQGKHVDAQCNHAFLPSFASRYNELENHAITHGGTHAIKIA